MAFVQDPQQMCIPLILTVTSAAPAESTKADAIIMEEMIFFIKVMELIRSLLYSHPARGQTENNHGPGLLSRSTWVAIVFFNRSRL